MFKKTDWTDERQASYLAEQKKKEDQLKPEIERIDREANEHLVTMRLLNGDALDRALSSIKDNGVRWLVQNRLYAEEMNAWLASMSEEERAEIEAIDAEGREEAEERLGMSCEVLTRAYGNGRIPLYPAACSLNLPGAQQEASCVGRSGDSICEHYVGRKGDYVRCAFHFDQR